MSAFLSAVPAMSFRPSPRLARAMIALLALTGIFVSAYLWLWKLGYVGTLICDLAGGGCATVQTSRWSMLFGLPVAAYGVGGYLAMVVIAVLGMHDAQQHRRAPTVALRTLTTIALVASGWFTYLEAFVIHAWCQWCVVSAILATLACAVAWAEAPIRAAEDATLGDVA